MTVSQYREAVAIYFSHSVAKLQEIAKDPNTKSLDVWIVMCILTAAKKGDYMTLDQMLNRIIGKVKEVSSVEMSGPDGGPIVTQGANPELAGFTKDELRKLLETIDAKQNAGADNGNAGSDDGNAG